MEKLRREYIDEKGNEQFKPLFDEIHIELGRDMKNPAEKRRKMTAQISENENTNLRIKAILTELTNEIPGVRPRVVGRFFFRLL